MNNQTAEMENLRVLVRMIFFAQSAISFLDISFRSRPIKIEEFVIVLRAVNLRN